MGLLTQERSELALSWRYTGFSVHNRVRVEFEDGAALDRLACCMMRPPISLERMEWKGVGEVQYRGKQGHDGAARQADAPEGLDAVEGLARVLVSAPGEGNHNGLSMTRDGAGAVLKDGLQ